MQISEIINDPQNIPTLPGIFYKIIDYQNDPDKTIKDYSDLVKLDPGITQKILTLVNSSYYGFHQKIDDLFHAIGIIGVEQLLNIFVSVVVIERFKGIPENFVTMESFWSHSLGTGIAARKISESIFPDQKDKMYLAGILHDLGSLIIYKTIPDLAKTALEHCNQLGMKLVDAENITIGFNHAQLGAQLMQKWGLPDIYSEISQFHHYPNSAPNYKTEAQILYLADQIVMSSQLGSAGESQPEILDQTILEALEVPPDFLMDVYQHTLEYFSEIFHILYTKG